MAIDWECKRKRDDWYLSSGLRSQPSNVEVCGKKGRVCDPTEGRGDDKRAKNAEGTEKPGGEHGKAANQPVIPVHPLLPHFKHRRVRSGVLTPDRAMTESRAVKRKR